MMIRDVHSCGDCGFLGSYEEYKAHQRRSWHRLVMRKGLDAALDSKATVLPDARRAVFMFREGGSPFVTPPT